MHSVPLGPLTLADPEVEGDTKTVKLSAFSDPTVTLDVDSANDVVVVSGWMVSVELLEVDPASAEVPPNEAVIEFEPTASWFALREHEPTPLARAVEHSAPVGPLTVAAPEVEGDTEMVKVSAFSDP